MSVSLATGGMFSSCCGSSTGGGAPPYRKEDNIPKVSVVKFEIETISTAKKIFENISVKLVNEED